MPSPRLCGVGTAVLNPYPIEFVDGGDHILLRIEEWGAERRIDLRAAAIPADAPRSRLGYSIGTLEGNVLRIRTGQLTSHLLDDDGIPMSSDAGIVETFTVNAATDTLDYEVTVADPQYLLEPATWVASWRFVEGAQIRPFECDAAAGY